MSRIGRKPINIPAGVDVKVDGSVVTVKGPKGYSDPEVSSQHDRCGGGQRDSSSPVPTTKRRTAALHGLTRTLIHNMVVGVTEGFKKELEVNGVGYRVQKQGKNLVMNLGYSHQVIMSGDRRHHHRVSRPPTRSSFLAPTSRRSASLPRKSARSVRRSRIRARVSSMLTRLSAARKARPVRAARSKKE